MNPRFVYRCLIWQWLLLLAALPWAMAQDEAYKGGAGSGYGTLTLTALNCNQSFGGGRADGAEATLFANPLKCDTTIYVGGIAGGHDTAATFLLPCNFYRGGMADGSDRALYAGANCNTYLGGAADGWAAAITASICNMYLGGMADGWAAAITESICLMYRGGIADGADAASSAYVVNPTVVYWRGANSNWFDSQNWSYCRVPDCTVDAIIPPTANNPVIAANGASVRSLTIQTGAQLTINATRNLDVCGDFTNQGALNALTGSSVTMIGIVDQAIAGTLAGSSAYDALWVNKPSGQVVLATNTEVKRQLRLMNGIVRTNASEIIVLSPVPTSVTDHSSASYVQGNLRRYTNPTGNYDFPVGTALKGYQLAQVFFTAPTAITNIRGFFTEYSVLPSVGIPATECGLTAGYVGDLLDNGKWVLDAFPPAASGTGTYTLRLHNANYTNASGTSFTVVKQPTGASGAWALNGLCNAASVPSLTIRDGMQGFSEFGTAMSADPFPVDLLTLEAQPNGNTIQLHWLAASEVNFSHYGIERATDLVGFEPIGVMQGRNVGSAPEAYAYTDRDVRPNVSYYYRLRLVNQDGSYRYSNVVQAILPQGLAHLRSIYPNPTNRALFVEFAYPIAEGLTAELVNQQGQVVANYDFPASPQSVVEVDLSPLPAGVYLLLLRQGNALSTHRVVKLNP